MGVFQYLHLTCYETVTLNRWYLVIYSFTDTDKLLASSFFTTLVVAGFLITYGVWHLNSTFITTFELVY
jgi:multisubunit Na+/H+ antiporter MnhF subunit